MNTTTHEPTDIGHEATDAKVRPIALLGLGLAILAVVVLILSRVLLARLDDTATRGDAVVEWTAEEPPGPQLQADPQADYELYRATQRRRLAVYDWVDRDAGTVQVPLERALELVLERGLPARAAGGAAGSGESEEPR